MLVLNSFLFSMSHASSFLLVTPTRGNAPYGRFLTYTIPRGIEWRVVSPAADLDWVQGGAVSANFITEPPGGLGMYAALNAGLAAMGDAQWFSYINDDDRLGKDMAELIRQHCRPGNENVIAYGRVSMISENGRHLYDFPTTDRVQDLGALLPQGIMPFTQQGMIAHRSVWERLGGFDVSYRLAGDLDFWVRAWRAGFKFRFYDLRVGEWRLRPGQLSGRTEEMWREQARCLEPLLKDPPSRLRRALAKGRFRLTNTPNYFRRYWRLRRMRQSEVFTAVPMSDRLHRLSKEAAAPKGKGGLGH